MKIVAYLLCQPDRDAENGSMQIAFGQLEIKGLAHKLLAITDGVVVWGCTLAPTLDCWS